MRVDLGMLVGKRGASKTIELDFVPMLGMRYDDGTWKGNAGKKITEVTIQRGPDKTISLAVALESDDSESLEVLKPTYEAHGWTIS